MRRRRRRAEPPRSHRGPGGRARRVAARRMPTRCRCPGRRSKARSPTAAPRPRRPIGEPLWELGLGVAGVRFPDYRGSDQSSTYALPLPYVAYRGRFLRADRDGARAILFAGKRVDVDISLSASVPTRSKDNDARAAACPTCRAPSRSARTSTSSSGSRATAGSKLDLRLPVREAITLETSPRAIGVTFSPNLNLDVRGFAGGWNLGLLAGPLFADRRHHEHFYGVAPEFATADAAGLRARPAATPAGARSPPSRAASATSGSAASSATTTCTARRSRQPAGARSDRASPPASASHGSSRPRASACRARIERRRRAPPAGAAGIGCCSPA